MTRWSTCYAHQPSAEASLWNRELRAMRLSITMSRKKGIDMHRRLPALLIAAILVPVLTLGAWAQQIFETNTKQRIRVVTMATGLVHPWSIAILPGGQTMLIGERAGRLRIMRNGVLDPKPVWEAPAPPPNMTNSLLWVVVHPRFTENRYVY